MERTGINQDLRFHGPAVRAETTSFFFPYMTFHESSVGNSGCCCSAAAAEGVAVAYGAAAATCGACPAAWRNCSTPRCGRRRPRPRTPSCCCCCACRSASSAPVTRCTMARKVAASVLMYVVGTRLDGRGRRRFPACPPAGPSRHRADDDGDGAATVGGQSVVPAATAPCISIAAAATGDGSAGA